MHVPHNDTAPYQPNESFLCELLKSQQNFSLYNTRLKYELLFEMKNCEARSIQGIFKVTLNFACSLN